MPLKEKWIDQDETMDASPEVVNKIAHAVIDNEEDMKQLREDLDNLDVGGAGKSPYIGENGNWYEWDGETEAFIDTGVQAEGVDGADGKDGVNGEDGYTPQKGVDYWTEEDKAEIIEEVEPFVVNFTLAIGYDSVTSDKSLDEIFAAYNNGQILLAIMRFDVTTILSTNFQLFASEERSVYVRFPRELGHYVVWCDEAEGVWKYEDATDDYMDYVDAQIGDIEIALDNIISKYGLGGDAV